MKTNQQLGAWGEDQAASWYLQRGLHVLERNWRTSEGEVDLVVCDRSRSTVIFCEVKTRSSAAFGSPAEAVTKNKQRRIRAVARSWLQQSDSLYRIVRFDVAEVEAAGGVSIIADCF